MDKHVIFVIFGSVISIVSLVSMFFIRRSNRKFLAEERKNEKLK